MPIVVMLIDININGDVCNVVVVVVVIVIHRHLVHRLLLLR